MILAGSGSIGHFSTVSDVRLQKTSEVVENADESRSGKKMMLPSSSPLRTYRASFQAVRSSLSNARFGGRGITIRVIRSVSLRMQLLMTGWMH